jgi:hypothetical protein
MYRNSYLTFVRRQLIAFTVASLQMIQVLPAGMRVEEFATEIDQSYSLKPDEFKIPDNIQFR